MAQATVIKSTYAKQWATVFALLYGRKSISANNFKTMLSKMLGKDWEVEENPAIYTEIADVQKGVIHSGHWKGRDTTNTGPIVTAIKWNIRKANHQPVTDEDLGIIRNEYRQSIIPLLNKLGIGSEYITARVYLTPFDASTDKGLPKLPAIPPEPNPPKPVPPPPPIIVHNLNWLYWVVGGVLGILVLKNMGKKSKAVLA